MPPKRFTFEERIRQDIMLLTTNEDFLADVQKLRDKHGYPLNLKDEEIEGYIDSKEFRNFSFDEKELMKKYSVPESHSAAFNGYVQALDLNLSHADFYDFFHLNPQTVSQNTTDCVTLKIIPIPR